MAQGPNWDHSARTLWTEFHWMPVRTDTEVDQ